MGFWDKVSAFELVKTLRDRVEILTKDVEDLQKRVKFLEYSLGYKYGGNEVKVKEDKQKDA